MTRTLVLEPEAEADIAQAAGWYEQRNPTAIFGFYRAIDRTIHRIHENPEQHQSIYRHVRRAIVPGYPYVLFFTVSESQIIIVSCFHTSRDPATWRERIR